MGRNEERSPSGVVGLAYNFRQFAIVVAYFENSYQNLIESHGMAKTRTGKVFLDLSCHKENGGRVSCHLSWFKFTAALFLEGGSPR